MFINESAPPTNRTSVFKGKVEKTHCYSFSTQIVNLSIAKCKVSKMNNFTVWDKASTPDMTRFIILSLSSTPACCNHTLFLCPVIAEGLAIDQIKNDYSLLAIVVVETHVFQH